MGIGGRIVAQHAVEPNQPRLVVVLMVAVILRLSCWKKSKKVKAANPDEMKNLSCGPHLEMGSHKPGLQLERSTKKKNQPAPNLLCREALGSQGGSHHLPSICQFDPSLKRNELDRK